MSVVQLFLGLCYVLNFVHARLILTLCRCSIKSLQWLFKEQLSNQALARSLIQLSRTSVSRLHNYEARFP